MRRLLLPTTTGGLMLLATTLASVHLTLQFDAITGVDLDRDLQVEEAASSSGLHTGDRIVAVDGVSIKSRSHLRRVLRKAPSTVSVDRDGSVTPLELIVSSGPTQHWNQQVRATQGPATVCLDNAADAKMMLQLYQTGVCPSPFVFR